MDSTIYIHFVFDVNHKLGRFAFNWDVGIMEHWKNGKFVLLKSTFQHSIIPIIHVRAKI